ncbi:NAD(P)/FAD-dependent oxidoreductase [Mycobacterium sp. 663a-19]|uniref:flavin-containing monooxygenase n=1 Tax=Mycobacterium sp. 663a-19 TaxID=2986148 RepID=UPI002D1E8C04|nr:NAD(P)/FAD-dependent oxidoreductase [Mycobacterium sp. 663a-19]MEB3979722.1 NAD(P)/FAD-dependent oxidoreductase [Mycobacterium sp. 663a-19]
MVDGTRQRRDPRIAIVGAGMAGIAVAHAFREAGFTNFTILEKGSDVGGVWHWNRYPGLRCDVPSYTYQFAFAPKPDWKHVWATGDEIQRYHHDLVKRLGLEQHLRLRCEVSSAVFTGNRWRINTTGGDEIKADFLVAATGVLHHPFMPDIPGLDSFGGPVVHTARWTDIETAGKRLAVIGTGSTGVQVFSALQPEAGHITHFCRTPQWVMWVPMALRQPRVVSRLLKALPGLERTVELGQRGGSDFLVDLVTRPTWRRRLAQQYGRVCLRMLVRDNALRARLTPDYEPFCKRQVISGNYYRAIGKPNASLVTEPIAEVTPTGIRTTDGAHHDLDAIVLATGFQAHNYMRPMSLRGRDGLSIDDAWAKGPRAWAMTAIPGFPNLFTVLGPNSPSGSMSLQYVAELTARYIVEWLRRFSEGEITTIEVTEEATNRFNADVAAAMGPTVWNTGCNSWYFADDNHIDLWPFDRRRLQAMLGRPHDEDYILTRSEPAGTSTRVR